LVKIEDNIGRIEQKQKKDAEEKPGNVKVDLLIFISKRFVMLDTDFKEYLCENYQVPVVINDDKIVPFVQFCKEIAGKKIKIETLRLQKDSDSACIQNIYVYYKVKGKIFWKKG